MGGWAAAMVLVVATRQPGLIADRLGPRPGTRRWDMVLLSLLGLAAIARCVVAGLDQRFHWSAPPMVPVQVLAAAVVVVVVGYVLVVWATAVNPFFAATARFQAERDHRVISDGPYRFIRHPGYLGVLLADLALPVLLGSWWALIPSAGGLVVTLVRTLLEDGLLQADLGGYRGYAARVRHRLLPGIW